MRYVLLLAILALAFLPASAPAQPPDAATGCPANFHAVEDAEGHPQDHNGNARVCFNGRIFTDDNVAAGGGDTP